MHIVSTLRYRSYFSNAQGMAFVLVYGLGLAAAARWSLVAPLGYARWREAVTTALPLMAFYAPSTWELWSRKAVEDMSIWDRGPILGALSFWICLVFATMLPMLLLVALVQPKWSAWQWGTQLAFLVAVLQQVPCICQAPLLQHPASQQHLGQLHAALRQLCMSFSLPSPVRPTDALCSAMLSTLLVMLGYVLPVGLAASWKWKADRRSPAPRDRQPALGVHPHQSAQQWLQGCKAAARQACWRTLLSAAFLVLSIVAWQACTAMYSGDLQP
jgi:hypothetical protein